MVWVLNKNQGDVLDTPADDGSTKPVRIDGLLEDSVFQSGLLLSEEHFLKLYPTQEGYQFFLIETPPGKEEEVRSLLNTALADRGFEAECRRRSGCKRTWPWRTPTCPRSRRWAAWA